MENNRRSGSASKRRSLDRTNNSKATERTSNANTASTRNVSNSKRANTSKSLFKGTANKILAIIIAIIVVVIILGAFTWFNISYLYDNDSIIPGVEIEGVDIGGLSREEAFIKLNEKMYEKIDQITITLTHQGNKWVYDSSVLNASGDVSGIIDQAIVYGHTGKLKQRMDEAKFVLENPEQCSISLGYDEKEIKQIIETLKLDLDIPVVEPKLEFDETAGKLTNIDDSISLLYNPLKYDSSISINGEPTELQVDANGNYLSDVGIFNITPGTAGVMVDVDATVAAIIADLADDLIANVEIVTTSQEPTLTEKELTECTSLVYHAKSGIDSSSTTERDKNVDVALSKFDGLVIMPGETISFNNTTGERSAANGFYLAPGIGQDKSHVMVYGGGVCQAATIIFNAALMSGCEILDKDSHSWPLYWRDDDFGSEARDAMVNWGTSDLVFKNITDYPIYFDTYLHWHSADNATFAYCNVYTKLLPDGQSLLYNPILVETRDAPEPVVKPLEDVTQYLDQTWKQDPATGLLVYQHILSKPHKLYEVYQQILDSSGKVTSETLWYKSLYDEITGLYYTKPYPVAEPVEGTTDEGTTDDTTTTTGD